jgi:hypothetical protein
MLVCMKTKKTTSKAKAPAKRKAKTSRRRYRTPAEWIGPGSDKAPAHVKAIILENAQPDSVAAFVQRLPVVKAGEVRKLKLRQTPAMKKASKAQAEAKERRRQQDAEEFKRYWERQKKTERRLSHARRIREARSETSGALKELLRWAMFWNTLEDFATARIGEVVFEAVECLDQIAASTSPAAPRAGELLREIKRRLQRGADVESKRRQRERERGGESPRHRSKVLTTLVVRLVGEVVEAHGNGMREFAGVRLPEWSFGGAYGNDNAGRAVQAEWCDVLMQLADKIVQPELEGLGKSAGTKWFDHQQHQVRREIKKCWQREGDRRRREHQEWVAQGMVS